MEEGEQAMLLFSTPANLGGVDTRAKHGRHQVRHVCVVCVCVGVLVGLQHLRM